MTRRLKLAALVLLSMTFVVATTTAQVGRRGAGPAAGPRPGPFSISGVVTDEATGDPIRRAAITISGSRLGEARRTITDDRGRFTLTSLPFGRVTLMAQKLGYLNTYYGSRRPGRGPGEPIGVRPAAPRAEVALKMPRGGVIAGTITGPSGRPAADVVVSLLQYQAVAGERQLVAVYGQGDMASDDRGTYRIYGLLPGDYLVAAVPSMGMPRTPTSAAQLQWAQQQSQRGRSGATPGPAGPTSATRPPEPGQGVEYARIFFPGVPDLAHAVPIALRTSEERAGVDFTLQYMSTGTIEATITGLENAAPNQRPQITVSQPGVPDVVARSIVGASQAPNQFTVRGLSPGQYRLTARMEAIPQPGGRGRTGPFGVSELWAAADVSVTGPEAERVTLAMRPGLTVAGRVVFDGDLSARPDFSAVQISLVPARSAEGRPGPTPTVNAGADGTFVFNGVVPGRYRITSAIVGGRRGGRGGPPAWTLRTIGVRGRDVLDVPFELEPDAAPADLLVTWFDRTGALSGRVLDSSNQPTSDYTVVLFPVDPRYWGIPSRRTLRTLPTMTGGFQFIGLLPGDYYLATVTDLTPTDLADSSFFEQLVPSSIRVSVVEGERTIQELRLAGGR